MMRIGIDVNHNDNYAMVSIKIETNDGISSITASLSPELALAYAKILEQSAIAAKDMSRAHHEEEK
jgi:hypothetical protein